MNPESITINAFTMLSIPKPCHEDWSAMTPEEKGRHCGVCCKVVVDFTEMPTEKVVEYISGRSSEKICGRFRSDQVTLPSFPAANRTYTGRLRIFLASLLLVFGGGLFSSCGNFRSTGGETKMGEVVEEHRKPDSTVSQFNQKPVVDSPVKEVEHPKGEVICVPPKNDSAKAPLMGKVKLDPK